MIQSPAMDLILMRVQHAINRQNNAQRQEDEAEEELLQSIRQSRMSVSGSGTAARDSISETEVPAIAPPSGAAGAAASGVDPAVQAAADQAAAEIMLSRGGSSASLPHSLSTPTLDNVESHNQVQVLMTPVNDATM